MRADTIRLTGLRVRGHHGVYDFERAQGQDFVVDVTLELDLDPAARSDNVTDTVHYGHLADERRLEIARIRQLRLEPEKIPGRTAIDAFLLARIDILVLVHPVGNPRDALGGPGTGF